MADAIYSERACALKTPHEDQSISNLCAAIVAQCAERPRDCNSAAKTATMGAADRQLLATLLLSADAADEGTMPVEAAEDVLQRLAGPGDRLMVIAEGKMIGVLVDRPSDTVLPDRQASSGMDQQA